LGTGNSSENDKLGTKFEKTSQIIDDGNSERGRESDYT